MNLRTMVGALWYLQSRSTANAIRVRIRRLKQPKYLIGAVLGLVYFGSVFGRSILAGIFWRSHRTPDAGGLAANASTDAAENAGATVLLGFLLMGWFFAKDRAALIFSEPEVANLFPAPLSRRLLLWFRILRGQGSILVSMLVILLITGRIANGFGTVIAALGWWVILSVMTLHGIGASFAVQRLTERGMAGWPRRLLTAAIPLGVTALLWLWYEALPKAPTAAAADAESVSKWSHFAEQVFHSGPAPWLLWPFRLIVRPLFARGIVDGWVRLLPAVGMLALHGVWVMRSAVSFEEASIEQSRKMAELRVGRRTGKLGLRATKRGREPFALRPGGPGWAAIWWSGLIESHETPRRWGIWSGIAVVVVVGVRLVADNPVLPIVFGTCAGVAGGIMILFGGQTAAQRFARVLRELDVVKALPISGWQVFLGSVLGGLTGVVFLEWLLLGVAACLLTGAGPATETGLPNLGAAIASAALVAPVATLFFAIPVSIGYVFFPGWFASGRVNPGFEAMGQRMLVGLMQLAAMALAAVPVMALGAPAFFLGMYAMGPGAGILLGAAAGTLALAAECAGGIWWIGRRFDGLDAAEER